MRLAKVIFITIIISFLFINGVSAISIDQVYYSIRGGLSDIESLQLRIGNQLDNVNTIGVALLHDGESFKLESDWQINFLKRPTYKVNLGFTFPLELSDFDLGKGIRFSGETFFSYSNKFYWNVDYILDRDYDNWIYEAGIIHPLFQDTSLIIGIGNTYWDADNRLNFGFSVNI